MNSEKILFFLFLYINSLLRTWIGHLTANKLSKWCRAKRWFRFKNNEIFYWILN